MELTYTVKQKTIELKKYDDYFNLWIFSDVHRDSPSCDADRWQWFLKKAAQDDPEKTYYLGVGDYHDFASWSERKALKDVHEQTMERFTNMVIQDLEYFAEETEQMKGKLIGLVEGNHTWNFENGDTATERLCKLMDAPYLGWLTHLTLNVKFPLRKSTSVSIVACHGKAGGKRVGTSINQIEDMKSIFPVADIYTMGHNHDRGAWPVDVLVPINGGATIKQKRQFLVRSGSFLKAYEPNSNSYVASRLLRPSDLGAIKLRIGFHRDRKDGDRIVTDIEATI